jgi:hypothetical protein
MRTTKEGDASYARFWDLNEQHDQVAHLRALLIVRPTNRSPNYTTRMVRKKPYKEQTLTLRIPVELDDECIDCFKMERLSWLYLLDKVCRFIPHNKSCENFFNISSCILDHHLGWQAPYSYIFLNAHHYLFLHIFDVLKMQMISHSIVFFKTYFSLDLIYLLLLVTLKTTYGSSIAYGLNL